MPRRVGVELAQFQIDRNEVTNSQFKKFLDAGGYQKRQFWKQPFRTDSSTLSWEEAMREFIDSKPART